MREQITAARLRELLHYDPETGVFTSLTNRRRMRAGAIVGRVSNVWGHLSVMLDRKHYLLHRLAFLYMTGKWPEHVVDHINGDSADNRWVNLRDVPQSLNAQNQRGPMTTNRSGYLGVAVEKGRYLANIQTGSLRIRKSFQTPEEAHAYYLELKRQVHPGCTI
jgi:hypothetical protein